MVLKLESVITLESEPCVLAWDSKLFVGTEEGSIRSFDANLRPDASWSAHAVQLFAISAGDGKVYSSSNDGGVRVWTPQGDKIAELPLLGGDVGILRVFGQHVYTGDDVGNIIVYENNVAKAMYNVLEEVKGMSLHPPFLFTCRDIDVTVTEIKPDESKLRFITRHTMEGCAPLATSGNRLIAMARGGTNMRLYDISKETNFKLLHEMKASDMIVTSMSVSGNYVWTGSWDGSVKRWKIATDQLEAAGEINLGTCVNALATSSECIYAVLAGGRVVCIKDV